MANEDPPLSAVGPFVFVMLGPQKSLSASFVVDAKGSQGFLAVLSASEATRDKCVYPRPVRHGAVGWTRHMREPPARG